jgi:DNA-binding XRE family transcriptional regulator
LSPWPPPDQCDPLRILVGCVSPTEGNLRSFGKRVRVARIELGLTQVGLGRRTGFATNWVAHIENGRRLPNMENLLALANALGVSTDWLLGRVRGMCDH